MIINYQDDWNIREQFNGELMPDENIQWVGQPDPNVIFSKSDILLIPFSLMWGGFAIFWEATALSSTLSSKNFTTPDLIFPLFGIPFVLIGLYMIFGRFLHKKWKKQRTYYAVTDKRVLVLTKTLGSTIQAKSINNIETITKSVGHDGNGSLIFGDTPNLSAFNNFSMDFMQFNQSNAPAFFDIKDANSVYELVNRLKNQSNN